jgi:hypothetical protein
VAANRNVRQLQQHMDSLAALDLAPPWELPPVDSYENERSARAQMAEAPKIILRRAHEIVAEKRETLWLLHKVLEAKVLAVIAGARGTFKSFIALEWMMRIALQGQTVAILSGEGNDMDRRIDAWMRTHAPDVDLATLDIFVYEIALNLSIPAVLAALSAAFTALLAPPAVIMIDTLSKFSAGIKENDNGEMGAYLSRLSSELRDGFKATVLLVAHTGHGDAARPRGAYALMANPDCEYIVQRPGPQNMTVTVSRERFKSSASLPPLAYEAKVIDLGRLDLYGESVTSLALVSADAPAPVKRTGKNQERALIALNEWARVNPGAGFITSIAITEIFKAQNIYPKRRKEVLEYLTNIRVLNPSIGGFTIDQAML